ncbi:hypothetical protein BDQ17DRAFT_456890 [Cyathus striatus]|nr:hypothetical protein BDQ17DRAFT_456890 [Cyathus striatus]
MMDVDEDGNPLLPGESAVESKHPKPNRRLLVACVPTVATAGADLKVVFYSCVNYLKEVRIVRDRNDASRGFGFVTYKNGTRSSKGLRIWERCAFSPRQQRLGNFLFCRC